MTKKVLKHSLLALSLAASVATAQGLESSGTIPDDFSISAEDLESCRFDEVGIMLHEDPSDTKALACLSHLVDKFVDDGETQRGLGCTNDPCETNVGCTKTNPHPFEPEPIE